MPPPFPKSKAHNVIRRVAPAFWAYLFLCLPGFARGQEGNPAPVPPPAAAPAANADANAADPAVAEQPMGLVDGECLRYTVRVWKGLGALGMNVGHAAFTVRAENYRGRPVWTLHGSAHGGAFGYTTATDILSHLQRADVAPVDSYYEQRGSEERRKWLVFTAGAPAAPVPGGATAPTAPAAGQHAVFLKHKHCAKGEPCADPNHLVTQTRGGWFSKREVVRVHCNDAECYRPAHCVWEQRIDNVLPVPGYDLLATLYLARSLPLVVGADPQRVLVVSDKDLWWVDIRTLAEQDIEVPAGTFRAKRIVLDATAVNPGTESKFEGLFGIKGSIELWVDAQKGFPVRIQGVVPLGIDLNVDVSLVSRDVVEDTEIVHRQE